MTRSSFIPILLVPLVALIPFKSLATESHEVELSQARRLEGLAKAFSLDLAGAGTWGPSIDFEMGSTVAFQARLRFPNGGLLSSSDLGNDSKLGFSGGAGVGVRWYPLTGYFRRRNSDQRLSSLYLGVLCEFMYIRGERVTYDWHYGNLAPQGQLGYRWRKNNWIFGVGADVGVIVNVFHQQVYWHGSQREASKLGPIPLIEGTLEIGYVF